MAKTISVMLVAGSLNVIPEKLTDTISNPELLFLL